MIKSSQPSNLLALSRGALNFIGADGSSAMFDGTLARGRQQPQFVESLCQILVIELKDDLT